MAFTAAEKSSMNTTSYTAFLAALAAVLTLFTLVAHARTLARWFARGHTSNVWKGLTFYRVGGNRGFRQNASEKAGSLIREEEYTGDDKLEDVAIDQELALEHKNNYTGAG